MSRHNPRQKLTVPARKVADLLRREWDPIGHGLMRDLPADEYDSYAPHLVGMIQVGMSDKAIVEHLRTLEADVIGVPSAIDLRVIAARIRAIVTQPAPET